MAPDEHVSILRSWSRVEPSTKAQGSRRFHIDVLTCMAAAAPIWLELERSSALSSPYQRYTWASSWQEKVGRAEGATPHIVVGRDHAGRAAFLWPLCRAKLGPLSVARFFGGKHSNANFPLWRPEVATSVTPRTWSESWPTLAAPMAAPTCCSS